MATKRSKIMRVAGIAITPEAVKLWRVGCEILDGADEAWEEDGGRLREFYDTCMALDVLLGFKPWNCIGVEFFNLRFEDCPSDPARRKSWELVQALERAVAATEPADAI